MGFEKLFRRSTAPRAETLAPRDGSDDLMDRRKKARDRIKELIFQIYRTTPLEDNKRVLSGEFHEDALLEKAKRMLTNEDLWSSVPEEGKLGFGHITVRFTRESMRTKLAEMVKDYEQQDLGFAQTKTVEDDS